MKNLIIVILILLALGIQSKANIYNGKDQITMFGHKEEIDSTQIYDILHIMLPKIFKIPEYRL